MKAYGYIRVSSKDQLESGSLARQKEAIERFYSYMLQPKGLGWGGIIEEEAVTASKPLCSRPKGGQMSHILTKGDYVIFAKLDRGFRCTRDLLATVYAWKMRGVAVKFLDIDVDSGSAAGELHLTIMGAVAQFERSRMSERLKQMHAQKRSMGMIATGEPPLGWKSRKTRAGFLLEVNEQERQLAEQCKDWMARGWSVSQVHKHLTKLVITGRKGRTPSRTQIWSLVQAAKNDYPKGGIRWLREHGKNGPKG